MPLGLVKKFITNEAGAISLGAAGVASAAIGLTAAIGSVMLVGDLNLNGDIAAEQNIEIYGDVEFMDAPVGFDGLERSRFIMSLPSRTSTQCAPVYDGGPVACSTPVTVQCELWEMTDGSERSFCNRS